MSVINTNITSLVAQQNLNKSQSSLTTAMQRLSSGSRINSAKDDAAGQAIANRMTSQITGLTQAQRNANDGISVAQTTEGALNQINDNLQRIRELTVQSQNSTNSKDDLTSIQNEITQRLDEIDRISKETNFNGVKVLASNQTLSIQVGANDNEQIKIDLKQIDKTTLGLSTFDVTKSLDAKPQLGDQVGYNASLGEIYKVLDQSGNEIANTFAAKAADGSLYAVKKAATADATNQGYEAVTYTDGTLTGQKALLQYQATNAATGDYSSGTLLITGKNSTGQTVDTGVTLASATFAGTDANTAAATQVTLAKGGLAQLDNALKTVDNLRSDLGAIQNRFDSAITNLSTTTTNLSAARSRIQDADYSVEVANMTKAQILQQAGTSVLAQANQIPQSVLSLLQ